MKISYKRFIRDTFFNFMIFAAIIFGLVAGTLSVSDDLAMPMKASEVKEEVENPWGLPKHYLEKMAEIRKQVDELHEQNEDVIGWVFADKTIDTMVMSNNGKGRTYYIDRGVDEEYQRIGEVFMEDEAENSFEGNSLLYGHNTYLDTMFSRLGYYRDTAHFNDSLPILIYDYHKDSFKVMEPFTVFEIIDGYESIDVVFESEEERIEYNKSLANRSFVPYRRETEIDWDADVVYLQTCSTASYILLERTVVGFFETHNVDGLEAARML